MLDRAVPLVLTGAAAALMTQPVLAQSAQDGTADQPVGEGSNQLQEVVVTARYRRENLQSTPLSITAITAADLKQQALINVNDIGDTIPNAYFRQPASNYGPTETIGLRGFSQTDFDYSFQPTVGMYVDDVYQGSLTGSSFDLADLQRVEVANGPQGTLFGMNSIGGAIRLVTNQPEDKDSVSLELTYGEKHRVEVVGIGNASLIPGELFARVVAVSRSEDSIGHFDDFSCEMKARGEPPSVYGTLPQTVMGQQGTGCALGGLGGYNHQGFRVALRYLPGERLELNLNGYYYRQNDEPPLDTLLTPYGGPHDTINNIYSQGAIAPRYGMNYAGNCGGVSCNPYFVSPSPWDNYASFGDATTGIRDNAAQTLNEYGASATADYSLTDHLHLKYIWSYRTYTSNWANDSDMTPFALIQGLTEQIHRQFTNELRVTGDTLSGRLDYTLGFFSYDAREFEYTDSQFDAYSYPIPPIFPNGLLPSFQNFQGFSTNNESGFVHLNFKLTDAWSVSGGWRYSDQYLTEKYAHDSTVPIDSITLPAPVVQSGSRGDWSGSLNYQITPTVFAYAEAASGATLPGFNSRIETIGQLQESVPGQKAINYEVGVKSDWLDHRLRANATAFYEDYKSYLNLEIATQCTAASSPNPGQPYFLAGGLCPAGTALAGTPGLSPWFYYTGVPAYMPGAELQLSATPIERLLVNFDAGWEVFHSKIGDKLNPGTSTPRYDCSRSGMPARAFNTASCFPGRRRSRHASTGASRAT